MSLKDLQVDDYVLVFSSYDGSYHIRKVVSKDLDCIYDYVHVESLDYEDTDCYYADSGRIKCGDHENSDQHIYIGPKGLIKDIVRNKKHEVIAKITSYLTINIDELEIDDLVELLDSIMNN
jgi:hypothetical protein